MKNTFSPTIRNNAHYAGNREEGFRPIDREAVRYFKRIKPKLEEMGVKVSESFEVKKQACCYSEDGKLLGAVMSPPPYLDWGVPINHNEEINSKPDRKKATDQHYGLIRILAKKEVAIRLIVPHFTRPEGVYTRDIAFTIGKTVYCANLAKEVRQHEAEVIVGAVKPPKEVIIEGGNVILGKNEVFLGVGDRTSRNSVEWLASEVGPQWTVTPIYLKPGVLHLDCAFCPIEGNGAGSSAIVYEGAFERNEDLQLIKERYGKIWSVKQEDYDTLAPNVLKLDKKTVIVNSSHENIAKLFREHHYEVIEHDYSEIIKGGGSYRCTFGPFHRED